MRAITLTPAEQRRAVALAHELLALLAPSGTAPKEGDKELAAELLPAWWRAFGDRGVSVAQLRAADASTTAGAELLAVLARIDGRGLGDVFAVNRILGQTLGRLADSGVDVERFKVCRVGAASGVALWECCPLDDPRDP